MSDCPSAPKADALPGCATPRTAEALRFPADLAQAESDVRGNVRRNEARTCSESPEKSRNQEPRRIYPSWLKQPYDKNSHDLAETLGRLADRTDAWKREEQERIAALAWCRANGNPHLPLPGKQEIE